MRVLAAISLVSLLAVQSFAQTPSPSPSPAVNPSPVPQAAAKVPPALAPSVPVPTPIPIPWAIIRPKPKIKESAAAAELSKNCARHYPGLIQGEVRDACSSAIEDFSVDEIAIAQTRCRLTHGEEPRLVMACLVGVSIAVDLARAHDSFKSKLQVCSEHYPQHTEIDAFLQESCLTGVHIPELVKNPSADDIDACSQISPERSFIGPCAVGVSLANDLKNPSTPRQQNQICEKYFDHRRFHLTYRACLNARSVSTGTSEKLSDLIKRCANIVSDPGNDNERAACIIGSNIHRALVKKEDVNKRFQKCGDNKVSYQDRDVLACLTAASLLDMGDRSSVSSGCKDVFKTVKGGSRNDCINSLNLF
ncbi:MAG TPA: hypothetical protein VM432_02250 [Bdellovibrionales bacterium]|jgi:hypothetical protein|nr:hypothetical protein [Bdellovibrionales bacterium]